MFPVLFLGHGGGPLPLLGDPGHSSMIEAFKKVKAALPQPRAIVVVSAHWEGEEVRVTGQSNPELLFDYYNFPKEAYEIEYPAKGSSELANQITQLFRNNKITATCDMKRGFDHGMFVPLKLLYPDADIPTVQVSLHTKLDPAFHIEMGEAMKPLRQDEILIVGSGLTFHNMKGLISGATSEQADLNKRFQDWLNDALSNPLYSENERNNLLRNWEQAPGARFCHPREEHLIPLHVCQGAAATPISKTFPMTLSGFDNYCYLW